MSIELTLTILSILLTIYGTYATVRSRYPGAITFLNEQTIELFDSIGSSIDGLEVKYDHEKIHSNLILINGAFVNTGKIDIAQNMVEKPITATLPEGYKWLSGNTSKSEVSSSLNILDDNNLQIETGLFRCGELVKFHALVQAPENKRQLEKGLSFSHRIVNTKKIKKVNERDLSTQYQKWLQSLLVPSITVIVLFAYALQFISQQTPRPILFQYSTANSNVEFIKANVSANKEITVYSTESEFKDTVSFEEFKKNLKGPIALGEPRDSRMFLFFMSIMLITLIVLILIMLKERFLLRKFYKILKNKEAA